MKRLIDETTKCQVCGTTDNMFTDTLCEDCEDKEYKMTKANGDGKPCKKCGTFFKTQYGNLRKHQAVCKG